MNWILFIYSVDNVILILIKLSQFGYPVQSFIAFFLQDSTTGTLALLLARRSKPTLLSNHTFFLKFIYSFILEGISLYVTPLFADIVVYNVIPSMHPLCFPAHILLGYKALLHHLVLFLQELLHSDYSAELHVITITARQRTVLHSFGYK